MYSDSLGPLGSSLNSPGAGTENGALEGDVLHRSSSIEFLTLPEVVEQAEPDFDSAGVGIP